MVLSLGEAVFLTLNLVFKVFHFSVKSVPLQ